MSARPPLLEIAGLRKDYGGLRPLRIASLVMEPGERLALAGLDAAAAEVLVNLVTGAVLPDEGGVRVLGASTAAIASEAEWLASLDRIGIFSPRAVLLDGMTLAQNLALPFTLQLDPIEPGTRARVAALATEAGLEAGALAARLGEVPHETRARVHLARALAFNPALLILEHAAALVPAAARDRFAETVGRVADRRGLGLLWLTADAADGRRTAARVLMLEPGTGALVAARRRRRWF